MLFYDYDCKPDRDIGQNVHEYLKVQFVQLFTYYFNKHFTNLSFYKYEKDKLRIWDLKNIFYKL